MEDKIDNANQRSINNAKRLRSDMTEAEKLFWHRVRAKRLAGYKFRRQHPIRSYSVDFACVKHRLIIEIDGWTHSSNTEMAKDRRRTAQLEQLGWQVLRFRNEDIFADIELVLSKILDVLSSTAVAGEVPAQQAEGDCND